MYLNSKLYADILYSQGFFEEALNVYVSLIEKNPNDKDVLYRIKSLTSRKKFKTDIIKLEEFKNINNSNKIEFEKWLFEI